MEHLVTQQYWFKVNRSKFSLGYKWLPANRAGWLVFAAYAVAVFTYPVLLIGREAEFNALVFIGITLGSTIALLTTIMYKGEPLD